MSAQAGRPCPRCQGSMLWDGLTLACLSCGYYHSPPVPEDIKAQMYKRRVRAPNRRGRLL